MTPSSPATTCRTCSGTGSGARWLDAVHRMLAPGGLLVFSSHNLGAADGRERPTDLRRHPLRLAADLVRMPRRVRNSRRLRPVGAA